MVTKSKSTGTVGIWSQAISLDGQTQLVNSALDRLRKAYEITLDRLAEQPRRLAPDHQRQVCS